jgi:hypothetical protein
MRDEYFFDDERNEAGPSAPRHVDKAWNPMDSDRDGNFGCPASGGRRKRGGVDAADQSQDAFTDECGSGHSASDADAWVSFAPSPWVLREWRLARLMDALGTRIGERLTPARSPRPGQGQWQELWDAMARAEDADRRAFIAGCDAGAVEGHPALEEFDRQWEESGMGARDEAARDARSSLLAALLRRAGSNRRGS